MIKSSKGVLYASYIDALVRGETVILTVPLLAVKRVQKGLTNEKYLRPPTNPKRYLHFKRECVTSGNTDLVKLTVTLSTNQRKEHPVL